MVEFAALEVKVERKGRYGGSGAEIRHHLMMVAAAVEMR